MKKIILAIILMSSILMADKFYIINNPVYTNIYSADNKIPEIGFVHLTWAIVKQKIKRKNKFYINKDISASIQANNKDYRKNEFDRGHFSANNADWDNNKSDMKTTFCFTNITPQYSKTNRYSYLKVENYVRKLVKKYKTVNVLNIAVPGDKFMKGNVNIPKEYFKIIMYDIKGNNTKECYKIPNDNKVYKLTDMKISCKAIEF